jgi:hypothetical protein
VEALFQNGLIEVAHRQNSSGESDLFTTWSNMRKSEKKVPYLPEDENYVRYLKSIRCNTKTYGTSNMSALFQQKLECGLETDPLNGGLLLEDNDVETELKRMFRENAPLFRNILDFLREQQRLGHLSPERFTRLYDYVYGCYSVNVPTVLGCSVNTKFAHIPFHIESGGEYLSNNATREQVERLRPTWAINPVFFDNLTFEEFAEIRRHLRTSKVREFYLGSVKSPWVEIEDAWEDYTYQLEQAIKNVLYEKKDQASSRILTEFCSEKYLANPRQQTLTGPLFEVVKSLVSFVPFVGEAMGFVDAAKSICGAVTTLSKRNERIAMVKEYNSISSLVSRETRVITKYDNPFAKP